ncbi:hypothetical protein ACE6ED_24925 [Paenibacillus sp. CN-4]|uniref:hypothetical protein n=1 Tax=Paenibacillus nanchangensis TaxID=3348343 RepID=UPI00397BC293
MSIANLVLFMEEEIDEKIFDSMLKSYGANKQITEWNIEKSDACLWVRHSLLEDDLESKEIFKDIIQFSSEELKNWKVKSAIFVQPSKEMNAIFLAASFCKFIYQNLNKNKNILLYHGQSGIFINEQIENLRFENSTTFYDFRTVYDRLHEKMVDDLIQEFSWILESYEDDEGWDGKEIQYTDLLKNLFMIRSDITPSLHLISPKKVENLKLVDKKILSILSVDPEKLAVLAGIDNRNAPLKEWWWHLDMVNSGDLLVDVEAGTVKKRLM